MDKLTISKSVGAYPTSCCGPYWMCAKHHAEAMKLASPLIFNNRYTPKEGIAALIEDNSCKHDDSFIPVSPKIWFQLLEEQRKDSPLPSHLEADYWNYKLGFKKL